MTQSKSQPKRPKQNSPLKHGYALRMIDNGKRPWIGGSTLKKNG
jgi:hypothetical protein